MKCHLERYIEHANSNYGRHTMRLELHNITIWFSYSTAIAYQTYGPDPMFVVSQNEWGPTTGRHLDAIDGGNRGQRVPYDEFCDMLHNAVLYNFGDIYNLCDNCMAQVLEEGAVEDPDIPPDKRSMLLEK